MMYLKGLGATSIDYSLVAQSQNIKAKSAMPLKGLGVPAFEYGIVSQTIVKPASLRGLDPDVAKGLTILGGIAFLGVMLSIITPKRRRR
jgi:hypothetical protein